MKTAQTIIQVVKEAASIYKTAKSDLNIEVKSGATDLVTAYDKKIQEFLFERLSGLFPGCGFLAEEGKDCKEITNGLCFIIDPIDGTTNFIKGFDHSAICVGLAKDKEMICGVVYDVDKDNMYYAEKGCGAYLNGERIHVSDSTLAQSVAMFGTCPYDHELAHKTFEITERVFMNALEIRRSGSAALDICYVASGKADLYYELIVRTWDWAAASIILTEAGGYMAQTDRQPVSIESGATSFICTNGKNTDEFFACAKI